MAGPYAHILVCKNAGNSKVLPSPLADLLVEYSGLVALGALSPDLPAIWDTPEAYASHHLPPERSPAWFDRFHAAEKDPHETPTNRVVDKALSALRGTTDLALRRAGLAWLWGYVGHVVTDVVVHPVVRLAHEQTRAAGGPRIPAGRTHTRCEVVMDTLLVKDVMGKEIAEAPLSDWLGETDPDRVAQVLSLWAKAIGSAYGESADPVFWYQSFRAALSGSAKPFQFQGQAYPTSDGIAPAERARFYDQLLLPSDDVGPYREKVFSLATHRVAKRWGALWECVNGGNTSRVLPDWDLATGENRTTDQDDDLWPRGSSGEMRPPL